MTLAEFTKLSGIVIGRCDASWGGTYSYSDIGSNSSVCGFTTEKQAMNAWLKDDFGEKISKAILKLLKESEKK